MITYNIDHRILVVLSLPAPSSFTSIAFALVGLVLLYCIFCCSIVVPGGQTDIASNLRTSSLDVICGVH